MENLDIRKGEQVALVGPNAPGKSRLDPARNLLPLSRSTRVTPVNPIRGAWPYTACKLQ